MSDFLVVALGARPLAALAAALLAANAVGAAAVLLIALARLPVRRAFGPAFAYQLWGLPPLLMFPTLLIVLTPPDSETYSAAAAWGAREPALGLLMPVWLAGATLLAAVFAIAQARFMAAVKAGRAGPAVVGLISPRIVLPADDGSYSPAERELIRAHERAHVARKDPRAAALAAIFQCAGWFNPFAHLASHLLRLDQELACDAAVMLSRPHARGLYAKTLLKTQLAAQPLPFGCYWPARGQHPLEVRIALLKPRPGKGPPRPAGGSMVAASVEPIRP
jgi:beta-lactamase regulating signal transducer with metallopeptidase domain